MSSGTRPPGSAYLTRTVGESNEFSWFAADYVGNIGLFYAGREGFVPENVRVNHQAHTRLVREMGAPQRSKEELWVELAAQGLFVYDWSGDENPYDFFVYRSPYHKAVEPRASLNPAFQARILELPELPVVRHNFYEKSSVSADEVSPSTMQKTALLAGASGLIGSQLLPLLLASERYSKVIVVGRRALPLTHPKLTQVVTELDRLQDVRLQLIADDVFCCLGTTLQQAGSKAAFYKVDFLYVVTLAALAAGNFAAQLMVVSSMGADAGSRIYYSRVKGEMEAAVRQVPFRAIHIFRPSLLLGARTQPRLGERVGAVLLGLLRPLLRGPLRKYRPVTGAAVAAAMLRAAGDDGGGIRVHLSDELTQKA